MKWGVYDADVRLVRRLSVWVTGLQGKREEFSRNAEVVSGLRTTTVTAGHRLIVQPARQLSYGHPEVTQAGAPQGMPSWNDAPPHQPDALGVPR